MSTWKPSSEINYFPDGEKVCQVCGSKNPDALWVGKKIITVCYKCAFKILPRLMADAACNRTLSHPVNKTLQISAFRAMLEEAEKNYWDAVACQFLLAIHEEGKHGHN